MNIRSFVKDLTLSTGPDLKYSRDKTTTEITKSVNMENFCRVPFFNNAERIDITKSSLPISVDIVF